jgi:hypothetical protein
MKNKFETLELHIAVMLGWDRVDCQVSPMIMKIIKKCRRRGDQNIVRRSWKMRRYAVGQNSKQVVSEMRRWQNFKP